MPGGENSVAYPPDPDEDEQVEIIIAVITEWFGAVLENREEDIEDCAGNIAHALKNRRHALIENITSRSFPTDERS
ncbi:MAG: hypothetical protein ACLQPH_00635 [Acidimicrobiales bacterium]